MNGLRLPAMLRRAESRLSPAETPEWLSTYRVYCLLTAAFVTLFGFAYAVSGAEPVDPAWLRFAISGLCLVLLLASFLSANVARNLDKHVYALFVVLSVWMVVLTALNDFSADYAATLVFFVAAISLGLSFIPSARLPLLCFQIFMTAIVTLAALATPEAEIGRVVIVGCMAGIAFVTDVAATVRSRLESDRQRYENDLFFANKRAEEMLRLKSAFINNMNHEIRTPLTGIIGFAEIISEGAGEDQEEFARIIQESGRRLMDTLTGILDLAHLEAGSFDMSLGKVDVNQAVREVRNLIERKAQDKNLSLTTELSPVSIHAYADHTVVSRIVYNLVNNGIKFTETGGVTVSTFQENDCACIAVEDTGIGIEPSFLPHMFDEFQQASSGTNRSYEGTGLGLTVAKRLIDLLQGSITIWSEPGVGSRFTVALPMRMEAHLVSGDGALGMAHLVPDFAAEEVS